MKPGDLARATVTRGIDPRMGQPGRDPLQHAIAGAAAVPRPGVTQAFVGMAASAVWNAGFGLGSVFARCLASL